MSDPIDIAMGGGAVGIVAWALLKWSGNRNVNSIDESLKDIRSMLKAMSEKQEEHGTRATRIEKDVDQLKKDRDAHADRIEGQGKAHREQIEAIRTSHHERMNQAAERMNQSAAALASAISALAKAEAAMAAASAALTRTETTIAAQAATITRLQMGRRKPT